MNEVSDKLDKLGHCFQTPPLVIGGVAMEYYGLRKAGDDIDFVIAAADHEALCQKYPDNIRDLHGDIGVCVDGLEIWNRICLFEYDFLAEGCIELDGIRIISLHKLLFMKAIAMSQKKYLRDLELIVKEILDQQYKA